MVLNDGKMEKNTLGNGKMVKWLAKELCINQILLNMRDMKMGKKVNYETFYINYKPSCRNESINFQFI